MKMTRMMVMALALCAAAVFSAAGMADAQPGWRDCGQPCYSEVSPDARAALQKHWNSVVPLKRLLYAKQIELDARLAAGASDSEITSLAKEINGLFAQLTEAQVLMRREMIKLGMPLGGPMGGFGYHGGMGYGRGRAGCGW
jgi:hypothetical protein